MHIFRPTPDSDTLLVVLHNCALDERLIHIKLPNKNPNTPTEVEVVGPCNHESCDTSRMKRLPVGEKLARAILRAKGFQAAVDAAKTLVVSK